MLKKDIRQEKILTYLSHSGRVSISELCTMFDIVPMTARRDLKELEDAHKLIRTHGGATLPSFTINDTILPFHQRMTQNVEQKERIAKAALPFIKNKHHIFLASGTTVHTFARMLKNFENLNIVTDAVNIAYELSSYPNIHLISLGGEIRHNSLTTTGPIAENNLDSFQLDCAFIGINAIDEDGNIFLGSMAEASIVRQLCRIVPEIYFLADETKLMKKDFIYICRLGTGRNLITNLSIPDSCVKTYESLGARVIPFDGRSKSATMNRKRSGLFATIWYGVARE